MENVFGVCSGDNCAVFNVVTFELGVFYCYKYCDIVEGVNPIEKPDLCASLLSVRDC